MVYRMAMVVGLCTIELFITDSFSLKDKRQVIKSLINRIRGRFNVSITEVDNHDRWQRATLAVAHVSTSKRFSDQVLSKIVDWVRQDSRVVLEDYAIEMF